MPFVEIRNRFMKELPNRYGSLRHITEEIEKQQARKIETDKPYEGPRTETESKLAALWSELLNIKPVGVNWNFFDLGGTSLTLVQMLSRMIKELRIQLSHDQFVKSPTIADIAAHVDGREGLDAGTKLEADPRNESLTKMKKIV